MADQEIDDGFGGWSLQSLRQSKVHKKIRNRSNNSKHSKKWIPLKFEKNSVDFSHSDDSFSFSPSDTSYFFRDGLSGCPREPLRKFGSFNPRDSDIMMLEFDFQLFQLPYFSIDVECVATGPGHDDRAVAQIALVDQFENVLLNLYVKPEKPVISYLTDLTGITAELIDREGVEFSKARELLRSLLPKNALLVGQSIYKDVEWMKLAEGLDFCRMIDLRSLWRVWNAKYAAFSEFSLHHCGKCFFGDAEINSTQGPHNAAFDALLSIRLFNLFFELRNNPDELLNAQIRLLNTPVTPSFSRKFPVYEGVCMGHKNYCQCEPSSGPKQIELYN